MQRKTLLSACIALALSGQGWAADITEIETTTGEKKNTNVTCPADPGKLSPEELKRLPSEWLLCSRTEPDAMACHRCCYCVNHNLSHSGTKRR